ETRVMPHIHISLQSGDNTVLKYMARRHNREQVIDFCNEIRKYRKNIGIGADLIAGFPREIEEMHQNSLKLIQEIGLVFGHIFPYSIRENTAAALMEQVPMETRRRRAKELRELAKKQLQEFTKEQMKLSHKVLIENEKVGRTENYLSVKLPKNSLEKHKIGDIINYN
ncbi:MAG: radical SAM protein, partial [Rickettsiales bacterium]|nr:radical SAM protein [Rickettsiales bacterium]